MKKKLLSFSLIVVLLFSMSPAVFGASKGTSSVAQLQKKITELTNQIKTLKSKLTAKDKIITTLSNNLETKENINKNLILQLSDKTEQLANKDDLYSKLSGFIYTDEKGNAVSKDTPGSVKWFEFKTDMTTIYLTPHALEKFSFIVNLSDQVLGNIASYFETNKLPSEVPVFIWFDEPVKKTGYGEYFASEKKIFINGSKYSPYNKQNKENFIGVYVHEYTHAYQDVYLNFNEIRGRLNSQLSWLNEGMADYIDHQYIQYTYYNLSPEQITMDYKYDKLYYKKLVTDVLKANNVTLAQLSQLPNDVQYQGYGVFESMIYYIEQSYGHDKLFDFIEDMRTQSMNESLIKEFGVSEEKFIQDWKKYFSL